MARPPTPSHLLIACLLVFSAAGRLAAQETEMPAVVKPAPEKLALLVGCTEYPYVTKVSELYGPKNDIPLIAGLLEKRFDFKSSQITKLFGWSDKNSDNPTRANIERAFRRIAETAKPETQVFILISGHGCQIPAANDESEIDGLDEVFLAADVKPWSTDQIPNAIRDDEFGTWLDAIKVTGAHIWIVFDCCHSGTMTRAAGPIVDEDLPAERPRHVDASDLQIPAIAFAKVRPEREASTSADLPATAGPSVVSSKGSLVAFYAAQSFEEAPELPRPKGAPRRRDRYFGLFSYTLVQTLQRQTAPLSYAELSQALVNAYRTERGSHEPTPAFVGDLSRQVLGAKEWPRQTSFQLGRGENGIQINAGQLHGVTPGSVFVVHPPAGAAESRDAILGYVRIIESTPLSSAAKPCDYREMTAVAETSLPTGARCELVFRDVGDMQVKIAVVATKEAASYQPQVLDALAASSASGGFVAIQDRPDEAVWFLHCVTARQAQKLYGLTVDDPAVLLVQRLQTDETKVSDTGPIKPGSPRVFSHYPLEASSGKSALNAVLQADMQRIFTWQNFWRVAGHAPGKTKSDLRLEVNLLGTAGPQNPILALHSDQRIEVQVHNDGIEDWWGGLVYLDRNMGITEWTFGAVKRQSALKRRTATVDASQEGTEGFVLLAYPMSSHKQEPDWSYLLQDPLGTLPRSGIDSSPDTPFARLMKGALHNKSTRGVEVNSSDQPTMLMRTWTIVPK